MSLFTTNQMLPTIFILIVNLKNADMEKVTNFIFLRGRFFFERCALKANKVTNFISIRQFVVTKFNY